MDKKNTLGGILLNLHIYKTSRKTECRTTRLKWEKEGIFPKRIKIGKGNHHGWILAKIKEWIEKKDN